ncbi:tripartite ATP-independent transporter DctP family solute receptor [Halanaerobium saccharolyticum]|uniref:Tripartite ATP-independent transporter DctP family solute receptor n=1 Tax=Halanaerobium saccharolyticum TaxID=43595 RepID=A0A4R7Z260_9FIRM|nr:TRAP transporter substrate-binding protein [Halanaerobium saccharolyticum]RAK06948.1 tripartite ATP-independent transporter DctP family solute receptor [Halanaerobium saccharolyticum]TDW01675.1 tripartite ATP-independent transporter DctP family solute receptor [Halanaerobium saccharolyticum]TDX53073.1 tripartite ATP-independent transporter DctP family solute receptor [Halanaerobium saccharolyticum]
MKKVALFLILFVLSVVLVGCSSTDESVGDSTQKLKLAHNLNERHPVHLALERFKETVEEKSEGNIEITIHPNGQLGSESQVLEQLQAGALAMTKVSAAALTSYSEGYNAFTLPYVFADEDHFFKSMESDAVQKLYNSTEENGFIGLTFYDSGARSFYHVDKAILTPEDLDGEKIRVMGFQSQIDMMKALGGTPVTMPYGDVYTSIQSGVIDGAESNPTALTNGNHGEVAKHFSFDEHTRIPDIVVISAQIWNSLTEEQQAIIKEAAVESTEYQKGVWDEAISEARSQAEDEMDVTFHEVDKEPFREAVQPMLQNYKDEYPEVRELLNVFKELE